MENKIYAQTETAAAAYDIGLRSYLLRVFNLMSAGLCLSALTAYLVLNTSLINLFYSVAPNGAVTGLSAFGWLAFIAPLIMVFAFGWVVSRGTAQQAQIMFWSYAAIMGISLAPIFLAYTSSSLTRVFLITAATFGGMSIYGYTTKRDLSGLGSFLIMGLWGLIIASIVNIFVGSAGLDYALSILGVLIFTGLTAFDIQKIRNLYAAGDSHEIIAKKAVYGALNLYLDFINLFLYLLRLLGDRR